MDIQKMIGKTLAPKIQKHFLDGLKQLAAESGVEQKDIQIYIRPVHDMVEGQTEPQPSLVLRKAVNWVPGEQVTFKQVMNLKLDLLRLEDNMIPAIFAVLMEQAEKLNISKETISGWVYKSETENHLEIKHDSISVVIYDNTNPVKSCPILELFEDEDD